jgi:hypothetical protein
LNILTLATGFFNTLGVLYKNVVQFTILLARNQALQWRYVGIVQLRKYAHNLTQLLTLELQTHALVLHVNLMLQWMRRNLILMSLVARVMDLSSQLVSLVDELKIQPLVLVPLKWINTSTTRPQSKIQRELLLILVTSSNDRVKATFVKSASRQHHS